MHRNASIDELSHYLDPELRDFNMIYGFAIIFIYSVQIFQIDPWSTDRGITVRIISYLSIVPHNN